MTRAFEMERAMGLATADKAAADPVEFENILKMADQFLSGDSSPNGVLGQLHELTDPLIPPLRRALLRPLWALAWKDQDKAHLIQYWQRAIDAGRVQVHRPDWMTNKFDEEAGWWASAYDLPQAKPPSFVNRMRYLMTSMTAGGSFRASARAATAEAAQQLAITAIALRRFQLAHATIPESLEQLVPQFFPEVPVDPYDGRPLRYRRKADSSWLLYSVGPDGKDDGGDASRLTSEARLNKTGPQPNFLDGRDLVWPRPATAEEVEKFVQDAAKQKRR